MSEDIKITFKCSEALKDLIGRLTVETDRSASEIIRCCIMLGIESIKAHPALVDHVRFEDRISDNEKQ